MIEQLLIEELTFRRTLRIKTALVIGRLCKSRLWLRRLGRGHYGHRRQDRCRHEVLGLQSQRSTTRLQVKSLGGL